MKFKVEANPQTSPRAAEGGALRSCLLLASLALFTLGLFGCGRAQYDKQEFSATAQAGQYVKPKVDIVVFQDTSGSMIGPMSQIRSGFQNFVNSLDSRWDYHLVVLPLLYQGGAVSTSKYILAQSCSDVNSAYCLTSSQKDIFNNSTNDAGWFNSFNLANGSTDLALMYMTSNLNSLATDSSNFLRSDAALAVIVLTNGEDTTAWNGSSYVAANSLSDFYVDRGDGMMVINYNESQYVAALNNFTSYLSNFQGSSKMKRFFAVSAAPSANGSCSGFTGSRYYQLAYNLSNQSSYSSLGQSGGYQFDFCNSSALSGVLNGVHNTLDSLIAAYIFNYAVIDSAPVASSIKVYKNGALVPQSATNGWTYEGYKVNSPTARWPWASNNRTGYFIHLNGTYEYRGTDSIRVDFQKQ